MGLPEKDSAVGQTALLGRLEMAVEMCSYFSHWAELICTVGPEDYYFSISPIISDGNFLATVRLWNSETAITTSAEVDSYISVSHDQLLRVMSQTPYAMQIHHFETHGM